MSTMKRRSPQKSPGSNNAQNNGNELSVSADATTTTTTIGTKDCCKEVMNPFRGKEDKVRRSPSCLLISILIVTMILLLVVVPVYMSYRYHNHNHNNHIHNPHEGLRHDDNDEDVQQHQHQHQQHYDYLDDMSTEDMWEDLDCERIFESERPVHSQQVWINARALYKRIIGDSDHNHDSDHDHSSKQMNMQYNIRTFQNHVRNDKNHNVNMDMNMNMNIDNGFSVPIEARQAPPKGRGIFALHDIKAGTLIWSTKKTARFHSGSSYREFIYGLEVGVACDVLQWAYVQDISISYHGDVDDDEDDDEYEYDEADDDKYEYDDEYKINEHEHEHEHENEHGHKRELRVSVDLDEGCFCNDGGGEEEGPNMGCDEDAAAAEEYKSSGGCKEHYFALRDIKAGEELLCSYGEFAISNGWEHFGLA